MKDDVAKVAHLDGLVYLTGDKTIVVGVPLDGEWILGTGDDLGAILEKVAEVSGAPYDTPEMTVRPYLTKEEVADEIRELMRISFEEHGHFAKVYDPNEMVVPPRAAGRSPS